MPTEDVFVLPPFKVIVPLFDIAWKGKGAFSVNFAKIPTELDSLTSILLPVALPLITKPSVEAIPTLFSLFNIISLLLVINPPLPLIPVL